MTKVDVLINGYAKKTKNGWKASSTIILIEDRGKRILIDPGANKRLLLKELKKRGLKLNNIDYIFLTHYHPDHAVLAGIFEKSLILDGDTVYKEDKETSFDKYLPNTNIEVIKTPGHAYEHASLIVKIEKEVVVIAGDVFWWTDHEKQNTSNKKVLINRKDPFVKDFVALKKSRTKILKIADKIIPGHGKEFDSQNN